MKILFLHGWRSVIGGVKPTYLNDAGHEVINPALDDDDFDAAVRTAQTEFDQKHPDVIVGSSRGGAVALNIDSGDKPLVLLCPAWKNWGTVTTVKPNTIVLHSRHDDVIPFEDSQELLVNSGLPNESLIEIGRDHRLADPEPLRAMSDACNRLQSKSVSVLDRPAISGRYLFPQARCVVDSFTEIGLNSLFVEYREYVGSTGQVRLVAMLGDGEAAMKAAKLVPRATIAFGRSIGSLYAIELVHRQPEIAGLILESGIANPSERFLNNADCSAAGIEERDVLAESKRYFNHKKKLSGYTNPLLTLHTENDGLVDISNAERNHKWVGSRQKRLLRFTNGTHNTIFGANVREYLDAISQFVTGLSS